MISWVAVIQVVLLVFLFVYPVQRFTRSSLDRRLRWRLLGIRWAAAMAGFVALVTWTLWDRYARGDATVTILVGYGILGAFYALGETLVRRRIALAGVEVRETIRGGTY